MMRNQLKKIIKASAGTGKTYRLSLEYVNLLLEFRLNEITFDEILVITFTRKATAEIRDSIFSHINTITSSDESNDNRKVLLYNFKVLFNRELNNDDISYLRSVQKDMLLNKHRLQISTIDSFVHYIFQSIIAPYLGLTDFKIDDNINSKYYPLLYQEILNKPKKEVDDFLNIFSTKGFKTIEQYDGFLESVINNRWIFHLAPESIVSDVKLNELHNDYVNAFQQALNSFIEYLYNDNIVDLKKDDVDYIMEKAFGKEFRQLSIQKGSKIEDYVNNLIGALRNEQFLQRYFDLLIEEKQFWNGTYCLRKTAFKQQRTELKEDYQTVISKFAKYALYAWLKPEERQIIEVAKIILKKYDEIKLREKVLTYNDVSYYTFKHLYDKELSLIDHDRGEVYNRFYESLTSKIRFMLIDEFQDTSIIQYNILLPIITELISGQGIKNYGGTIIVGDEKQSIYGWRGGEMALLINMPKILQIEETDSLKDTYRSTKHIISFINDIFKRIADEAIFEGEKFWDYPDEIISKTKEEGGLWQTTFYNESNSAPDAAEKEGHYQAFISKVVIPALEPDEEGRGIDPARSAILARTNKDLEAIATLLDETNIPYLLESSSPILEHQIIKPVVYLLNYLANKEINSLLAFMRSDYCLISTEELRQILLCYRKTKKEGTSFLNLVANELPHIDSLKKTLGIEKKVGAISVLEVILNILESFSVPKLFASEQYSKMLHLFMEIAADFQNDNSIEAAKSLSGFLAYLDEQANSEKMKQISLESSTSIQLMTFHKSKGLQFDNVFVFYKPTSSGGGLDKQIDFFYQMNGNYSGFIEDSVSISYNYTKVLKVLEDSSYKLMEVKEYQEEINNFYVALTRAKTSLHVFLVYKNTGGLQKYLDEKPDEFRVTKLLYKAVYEAAGRDYNNIESFFQEEKGKAIKLNLSPAITTSDEKSLPYETYFRPLRKEDLIDMKEFKPKYQDLGKYLHNKQNAIGNVAHYYLSLIKYATQDELDIARNKTMSFYGNLVISSTINETIKMCNSFIENNMNLFDKKWSKIFTELSVFNKYGKEFRVDRLLINETEKKVLIIDYKTGSISEEDQIETYAAILAEVPYIKDNKYNIETKYVNVL